jgi:hypothetical protein
MPLIDPKPSTPPFEVPHAPIITKPEYQGVTVDTRYIPNTALLSHIEGSSWTVNYYSQVLAADSPLAGQNVTMNALHQQYRLIKGLELKVTSPLTSNQDPTSKAMVVTGVANLYPFITPNDGDMFLADIGDGREGIFKVTITDRKSVFKETIHSIEYQLIDYSTELRRGDLNSKTVKILQFVRDFMNYKQNPLLEEDEYATMRQLQIRYYDIASRYFKSFLSDEYKTLIIPGQEFPVYDHFLTSAVLALFTTYDTPVIRNVRKLNADGDDVMKCTTIWDVLVQRDINLLRHCNRQAGMVYARSFERNPMMEGIFHSGIKCVVYPKDPEVLVDYQIKPRKKELITETLKDTPAQMRRLADLLGDKVFEGLTKPDSPPIWKVLIDDYYVLSKNFYDNANCGQSLLELCVRDYLMGKAPNNKALLALCETYHAWGGMERFYYVPILLLLIKGSIRSI